MFKNSQLTLAHGAQLINYLVMLDRRHGKLVNLRPPSVESHFENAPRTMAERQQFAVFTSDWAGPTGTMDWVVELLRDWGTGLELPLYHQALVHFLGGEANVIQQLPVLHHGLSLGNQRFHLMEKDAAFRITAFENDCQGYQIQLLRLLRLSPLKAIHWINIAHGKLAFTSLRA